MTMMMVDYNPQFTPLPPSPPPLSDTLWGFPDHSLPSTPTMNTFCLLPCDLLRLSRLTVIYLCNCSHFLPTTPTMEPFPPLPSLSELKVFTVSHCPGLKSVTFGENIRIPELSLEAAAAAAAKEQDSMKRPFRICASGDKSFKSEDHHVYNAPTMNNEAAGNIDDKNHGPHKKQKLHATTSDGRDVSSLAQALDATTATVGQQNKGQTELNTLRKSGENITLADIERFCGKSLSTAAGSLGVSRSTLKRCCRKLGILHWRSIKKKKGEHYGRHLNLPTTAKQETPSSTQRGVLYDGSRHGYVTVKARYQGNTIKFDLPVFSKMDDLVWEVKKRINLEVGKFGIKYTDEDDDLISVTCDDDWKICMHTMGLQAKIQMLIEPSND